MALEFVPKEMVVWLEADSVAELAKHVRSFGHGYGHERYRAFAITVRPADSTWVFHLWTILDLAEDMRGLGAREAERVLERELRRSPTAREVHSGDRPPAPAVVGNRQGVWVEAGQPPGEPPVPAMQLPSPMKPSPARPSPPASPPAPPLRSHGRGRARGGGGGSWLRKLFPARAKARTQRPRQDRPPEPPAPSPQHPRPEPSTRPKPPMGHPQGRDVLSRTPHLETDTTAPLEPGDGFTFSVWCDEKAPSADEAVVPVTIEAPPEQQTFPLDVWIAASPHFDVERSTDTLVFDRDEPQSATLQFAARVVDEPPPGSGTIAAMFSHAGRACGQVTRTLKLAKSAGHDGDDAADPPVADEQGSGGDGPPGGPPRVVVRTGQAHADITIEIKALDADGRAFACRVLTPGATEVEPVAWEIPQGLPATVASYMEDFTSPGLGDAERRSKLIGAGLSLWEEAPSAFTSAFWDLAPTIRSILIVTDDWSFPWELLVPTRGRGVNREQLEPLGVAYQIGRWVTDEMIAPQQEIPLVDSYAFAPWYQPPEELKNAPAEAEYVRAHFNGELIKPGDFAGLEQFFGRRGVSLVHFVCHGEAPVGRSQAIKLQGGGRLLSHQLAGMPGLATAIEQTEPFVFLNACEVGRGEPVLIGAGGFATAFIGLGARCVIAPLWSIEDSVAHEFATAFYAAIQAQPSVALAEIVRGLRARAYAAGGADSWAAYCLYSDPLARASLTR